MSNRKIGRLPADVEEAISHLRENSLGRLLLRASRQYNEAAIERVRELGHKELTVAHASILPHIDLKGTRLTDVAKRAGLTKQSASELLSGLQQLGYLTREPDPEDRRAQRVVFTARGRQFLLAAHEAKSELEQQLFDHLGRQSGEQLICLLKQYLGQGNCPDASRTGRQEADLA